MTIDSQTTDQQLILAFKQGNTRAGEELCERYYPGIMQLCCRRMRSLDDGKDVAQMVFLKVIGEKKIFEFRGQSLLRTWLVRIAINACNSQFDRRHRFREINFSDYKDCPEVGETIPCSGLNPEEWLSQEEDRRQLNSVLTRLPKKYQQALSSTYLEDQTYREAAQSLGVPMHALGVQIMRGKQMLVRLFGKNFKKGIPAGSADFTVWQEASL
jgi:RNA polymerase sigma-70 factor (ECF subfamily)